MKTISQELALRLLEWHGGQFTPLYALGSSGYAGHSVPNDVVDDALSELGSLEYREERAAKAAKVGSKSRREHLKRRRELLHLMDWLQSETT